MRWWITSDEIPDRGRGGNRSLHRCPHGAGWFRCHAFRARAPSARHAGTRRAGEKRRRRFRGPAHNRQLPRSIGAARRCLSRGKGAWTGPTCTPVEAGIGARYYRRQHAEWNSMVVLPGVRWRMGGIASGACRSRWGNFVGHRGAIKWLDPSFTFPPKLRRRE